MTNEPTITLTLDEYQELKWDSDFLKCLMAAGVDNWEGYDFAQLLMDEKTDDT